MTRDVTAWMRRLKAAGRASLSGAANTRVVKRYWTRHNVTLHHPFSNADESLEFFHWRNDQYFNYIDLMPVHSMDSLTVLDFGCGPGHDLVGLGVYSRPSRLIGMDVSSSSLAEASARLTMHGLRAELVELSESTRAIPLEDSMIDHIHCSGVLHHTEDPSLWLREFWRVLKPGGTGNIMVYNYHSLWMHLYVAYRWQIVERRYSDLDLREAFGKTTDGEDCPISRAYTREEFVALCQGAGLDAAFSGAAVAAFEVSLLPDRHHAIMDRRLNSESRRFLRDLEFDRRGLPLWSGHYAGVDGCYRIKKTSSLVSSPPLQTS